MAFRLLCDEMTTASLAAYSRKLGHDVERVVTVPELGPGTDDEDVVAYAERENRLRVTADDDFLTESERLDRIGVLFLANDRMAPFEAANVVDAVADQVDHSQVVERDEPFHLTGDWL